MKCGKVRGTLGAVCAILLAGLLTGGCSTQGKKQFADLPPEDGQSAAAQMTAATPPPAASGGNGTSAVPTPTGVTVGQSGNEAVRVTQKNASSASNAASGLGSNQGLIHVGDFLNIVFSDTPNPILPIDQKISDDGKITLLYNQTFDAAGKTCSMLANEIRDRYVGHYFVNITVTVNKPVQYQYFYVDGEVKAPSRMVITGPITVTQAIAACGGYTEFAKKTNVELIRMDGRKQKINCIKALQEPRLDPQVYPGDKIVVHRKIL